MSSIETVGGADSTDSRWTVNWSGSVKAREVLERGFRSVARARASERTFYCNLAEQSTDRPLDSPT
jgi:hypothetical protein